MPYLVSLTRNREPLFLTYLHPILHPKYAVRKGSRAPIGRFIAEDNALKGQDTVGSLDSAYRFRIETILIPVTKNWQVESLVSLLKILVPVRVVAAHHRQQHFGFEDICWRDSEDVLRQYNEVCELSR